MTGGSYSTDIKVAKHMKTIEIHSEGKNSLKTIDNSSSGGKSYKVLSFKTENNQSSSNHHYDN